MSVTVLQVILLQFLVGDEFLKPLKTESTCQKFRVCLCVRLCVYIYCVIRFTWTVLAQVCRYLLSQLPALPGKLLSITGALPSGISY